VWVLTTGYKERGSCRLKCVHVDAVCLKPSVTH